MLMNINLTILLINAPAAALRYTGSDSLARVLLMTPGSLRITCLKEPLMPLTRLTITTS